MSLKQSRKSWSLCTPARSCRGKRKYENDCAKEACSTLAIKVIISVRMVVKKGDSLLSLDLKNGSARTNSKLLHVLAALT